MDTVETTAERLLARTALARVGCAARVLVGGIGLGFTLTEVLAALPAVQSVVVAEIEPALLEWHRAGLIPQTASWLADLRVRAVVADVADVVTGAPAASFDVVLLDVDNGPQQLVYDANASLYRTPFLRACRDAIAPGGVLAFWSADASTELAAGLAASFDSVEEVTVPVTLGRRESTYSLLLGRTQRAG